MSARTSEAPRFLFVTGTDTGVGKTAVSCALLAALRGRGALAALKPIETGVTPGDFTADSDGVRLAAAAGLLATQTIGMQLLLPLAPEAAAQAAGMAIDPQALVALCRTRAAELGRPLTLIEGAGGLLVPIAPGFTMADLARELAAQVLIVARTRLGTINHTLLTVAECRRRRLPVCGVVLNRATPESGIEDRDNAALIASHGSVPVWGPLPHLPSWAETLDTTALARAAEAHLPELVKLLAASHMG